MNAQMVGKPYDATAAIATHAAFIAIAIIIHHFKIEAIGIFQQHQSIGPNTKMPMAKCATCFLSN